MSIAIPGIDRAILLSRNMLLHRPCDDSVIVHQAGDGQNLLTMVISPCARYSGLPADASGTQFQMMVNRQNTVQRIRFGVPLHR